MGVLARRRLRCRLEGGAGITGLDRSLAVGPAGGRTGARLRHPPCTRPKGDQRSLVFAHGMIDQTSGDGPKLRTGPSGDALPDRASRWDRATVWLVAASFAAAALALGVVAISLGMPSDGIAAAAISVWIAARAVGAARTAITLERGRGSFVFVDECRRVPQSSRRWFRVKGLTRPTGHWFCLVDSDTEEPVGWVEVHWWTARRLQSAPAAALFEGAGGRQVLTGPFRHIPCYGRPVEEPPQPRWS